MNVKGIRRDFPILQREINGKGLVYLDNSATTQKPAAVIGAIRDYYERYNANVHRSIHTLGEEATAAYEGARAKVAGFINAPAPETIIFVRNASEALNLVSFAWGRKFLHPGDEILLSLMEHHSNLVPWQLTAQATGAKLRFMDLRPDGTIDMERLPEVLTARTRLVSITQMSNVLGTIVPIAEITKAAHAVGAKVLVDGAQSVPQMPVDVQELEADFLAFSAHKMCGPMGIGVLYGKRELLAEMDPFLGGGEMIRDVGWDTSTWNDLPWKFEAGTPNVAGAVGLGAAIDYLSAIGMEAIQAHDQRLAAYAIEKLAAVEATIYGPQSARGGLVAFSLGDVHPHDVATVLDSEGVAIRAGHHCAQPLHRDWLRIPASNRASFYIYNDESDIDRLVEALQKTKEFFAHVT